MGPVCNAFLDDLLRGGASQIRGVRNLLFYFGLVGVVLESSGDLGSGDSLFSEDDDDDEDSFVLNDEARMDDGDDEDDDEDDEYLS